MKSILPAAALLLLLTSCLFDESSDSPAGTTCPAAKVAAEGDSASTPAAETQSCPDDIGSNIPGANPGNVDKNKLDSLNKASIDSTGKQKERGPDIIVRRLDSMYVIIEITPNHEEDKATHYWIYRNGEKLPPPIPRKRNEVRYYLHEDSLPSEGTFKYEVYYGETVNELGFPTTKTIIYVKPTASGVATITTTGDPITYNSITIRHRPDEGVVSKSILERKIGVGGQPEVIDTVVKSSSSYITFRDTSIVVEDTMVYYRARSYDARTETWLKPTLWDSAKVSNKTWNDVPIVKLYNLGTSVYAKTTLNTATSGTTLYLYRNSKKEKAGATLVDSLEIGYSYQDSLKDFPSTAGTYYYWVIAKGNQGRETPRSEPQKAEYTGKAKISITNLSRSSSYIRVYFTTVDDAIGYVVEYSLDTTKAASTLDTISITNSSSTTITANVTPNAEGKWSFRVYAIMNSGAHSEKSDWSTLTSTWTVYYSSLSGVSIVNKGATVDIILSGSYSSYGYTYTVYRSKNNDYKNGTVAATKEIPTYQSSSITIQDTPPKGVWYYWVVRKPTSGSSNLARTSRIKVNYTGAPEIHNLLVSGNRVRVYYYPATSPDQYQLWRSDSDANNLTTFKLITTLPTCSYSCTSQNSYYDMGLTKNGVYHYRLVLVRTGENPVWGGSRSILFTGASE